MSSKSHTGVGDIDVFIGNKDIWNGEGLFLYKGLKLSVQGNAITFACILLKKTTSHIFT